LRGSLGGDLLCSKEVTIFTLRFITWNRRKTMKESRRGIGVPRGSEKSKKESWKDAVEGVKCAQEVVQDPRVRGIGE